MTTFQETVDRIVENAACRVAPLIGAADVTGRDRDDYRNLFLERAWLAQKRSPGAQEDTAIKWTVRALRNQFLTFRRELGRHPEIARYDLESEVPLDRGFAKRMEQRDLLQKLRESISIGEWELLKNYLEHGCNASSVWRYYGRPISLRGFCKKMKDLRLRCQKIIIDISNSVPIS